MSRFCLEVTEFAHSYAMSKRGCTHVIADTNLSGKKTNDEFQLRQAKLKIVRPAWWALLPLVRAMLNIRQGLGLYQDWQAIARVEIRRPCP